MQLGFYFKQQKKGFEEHSDFFLFLFFFYIPINSPDFTRKVFEHSENMKGVEYSAHNINLNLNIHNMNPMTPLFGQGYQ